jgi:hypothetical protein
MLNKYIILPVWARYAGKPDSGLKDSPHIGSDKLLNVQSVFLPELLPGTQIHVESSVFNGFATIQSVRFSGANFGENWQTEAVCKIL